MRAITLPITAIVGIITALLVLVVIVAAFIKGGAPFSKTTREQAAIQACHSACQTFASKAAYMEGDCSTVCTNLSAEKDEVVRRCKGVIPGYKCYFDTYTGYSCYIDVEADTCSSTT